MGWNSQVVVAGRVVIQGNQDGLFVYSGPAGPGDLLGTAVPPSVTDDGEGNMPLPGITAYDGASAVQIDGAGRIRWYKAATQTGPWTEYTSATIAQSDVTTRFAAGTSYEPLTEAWPIAAGDAAVGTVYQLEAMGTGNSGATPADIDIQLQTFTGPVTITMPAASMFGTNQIFSWEAECWCQVQALGNIASGQVAQKLSVTFTANTAAISGTNSISAVQVTDGQAADTTVATTMRLSAQLVAGSLGEQLQCTGSIFEREGP